MAVERSVFPAYSAGQAHDPEGGHAVIVQCDRQVPAGLFVRVIDEASSPARRGQRGHADQIHLTR